MRTSILAVAALLSLGLAHRAGAQEDDGVALEWFEYAPGFQQPLVGWYLLYPYPPVVGHTPLPEPPPGSYQLQQPMAGSYQLRQPMAGSYQLQQPMAGSYQLRQPMAGSHQLRRPVR